MDQVLYCDAIKGDFDLALLLQAGNMAELQATVDNKIKKLPGVKEAVFLPVDLPHLPESVANIIGTVRQGPGPGEGEPRSRQQRQFLEKRFLLCLPGDREGKAGEIYPTLYINDQVVSCDCIAGKYDIVLLMQGASFAEIDRNIQNKIKPLDGVLRIKELPIIKLFEM